MQEVAIMETTESAATDKALRGASLGKVGRSAAKRQKAILQLERKLRYETRRDGSTGKMIGPNQPCTLVNFNPIDLTMQMEGRRITVPAVGRFTTNQVKLRYAEREIQGHYLQINSPILYTVPTGHETDSEFGVDVQTSAARHFSPHAIGCAMWNQYNSPNNKLMGGVLLFDQEVRALTSENLARWGGRIWVPERTQLEDSPEYVYSLRETLLEDELERIFSAQRAYCDVMIQQAHALWAEQDVNSRKMVTDTHREWARYAVAMYWMKELPEWVTQKISASGPITELVKCKYCGTQQPSADVLFCKACPNNAPYDAYKAFKWRGPHGERVVVPQVYLEMLEGEQLEDVLADLQERAARRARFAALTGTPSETGTQATATPSKQLHGAARAAAEAKAARDAAAQQGQTAETGE